MLVALALLCAAPSFADDTDLDALVAEARDRPRVRAQQSRAEAEAERARVAGAWSDPMLSVEYSNVRVDNPVLSGHPMSGLQFRVQQGLHLPGWSAAAREVGKARVAMAGSQADELALRAEIAVREPWWRLTRERLQAKVTAAHLQRTRELLSAAESRYATGAIGQHAVLRLTVERDRLEERLADHGAEEIRLRTLLAAALGRDELPEVETPDSVPPLPVPAGPADPSRPQLDALEAGARIAEARAEQLRIDARPDVNVWAGYRLRTINTAMDDGADLIALGVGVPLPIASTRKASAERAAAILDARDLRLQGEDLRVELTAGWASIRERWDRSAAKTRAYDQRLLPAAKAMLSTTRSDFSTGRASFADLLEAERALLELERARIDAAVQTHLYAVEALGLLGRLPQEVP